MPQSSAPAPADPTMALPFNGRSHFIKLLLVNLGFEAGIFCVLHLEIDSLLFFTEIGFQ